MHRKTIIFHVFIWVSTFIFPQQARGLLAVRWPPHNRADPKINPLEFTLYLHYTNRSLISEEVVWKAGFHWELFHLNIKPSESMGQIWSTLIYNTIPESFYFNGAILRKFSSPGSHIERNVCSRYQQHRAKHAELLERRECVSPISGELIADAVQSGSPLYKSVVNSSEDEPQQRLHDFVLGKLFLKSFYFLKSAGA